jgi:hypothetical protein
VPVTPSALGGVSVGVAVRFMWGYARIKWLKVVEKDEKCPGC